MGNIVIIIYHYADTLKYNHNVYVFTMLYVCRYESKYKSIPGYESGISSPTHLYRRIQHLHLTPSTKPYRKLRYALAIHEICADQTDYPGKPTVSYGDYSLNWGATTL
ncbi:hypothetical protein ALC62_10326 [Cyphomyrmex costatus]|uniref:Uncharacterized protein n=1 Tax=Cyphomyrmex costatus TaxID=456900 RepID=A0A151IE68_9HYME|nr:hypothetical protein ALC62_10326 [Cyphomyrmex costatus]